MLTLFFQGFAVPAVCRAEETPEPTPEPVPDEPSDDEPEDDWPWALFSDF